MQAYTPKAAKSVLDPEKRRFGCCEKAENEEHKTAACKDLEWSTMQEKGPD